MKKKKLIIVIVCAVVIVLAVVLGIILFSNKQPVAIMDKVDDKATQQVLKKEMNITFGKVTKEKDIYVEYTIENISDYDMWFNLEVIAYDDQDREVAVGFINEDKVKQGKTVSNKFIMDLMDGYKQEDLEKATIKVSKAYSQPILNEKKKKES